jgi:hypothetical protein
MPVTFLSWLGLALIGRLLMFLWHKQPLSGWLGSKSKHIYNLFECDLCLGVWAYSILAIIFNLKLVETGIPILGEFMLGCVTAFIGHLVRIGWQTQYSVIHME